MPNKNKKKNKILTIPNFMSAFRIVLIPFIVWAYCERESSLLTIVLLVVSGITDVADGRIARKFDMVSDFGKALDPVADKLTQAAILFCLFVEFPLMRVLFVVLIVKELIMIITNGLVIRKTGNVYSAEWHGKVTTFLLYFTAIFHIIWGGIPNAVSTVMILLCLVFMLLSLVLYTIRNIGFIKNADSEGNPTAEDLASGDASAPKVKP